MSTLDPDWIGEVFLRLERNEALRRRLSEKGVEFVRRFTWKRMSRETLSTLEGTERRRGEP